MRAMKMFLAAGAACVSLGAASPLAAQYYPPAYPGYPPAAPQAPYGNPGYGYPPAASQAPYGNPGYGYAPNGYDRGYITNTCASAVQARLSGNYGYRGYGFGRGRVLGVTRIEPRESGKGWRVWGVATGGYGYNQGPDIVWSCRTDFRGVVVDVDLKRGSYGYNYTPWGDNNAPYGYRRY